MRQNNLTNPDDTANFVLRELARVLVQLHIFPCWGWRLWQGMSGGGLNTKINSIELTAHIWTSAIVALSRLELEARLGTARL
jgi:hypothetical protein